VASYTSSNIVKGDFTFNVIGTYTQDVAANATTFSALSLRVTKSASNSVTWNADVDGSYVRIEGTGSVVNNIDFDMRNNSVGSSVTLFTSISSGSPKAIAHNSDGTKTATISYYFPSGTSNVGTVSGSISLTLPTIARATTPTLSAGSVQLGSSVTIYLPRASSSFTHNLSYNVGSLSGQTAGLSPSSGAGDSATFTPPASIASQVTDGTSIFAIISVTTMSGSTVIGTKTIAMTLFVPSAYAPSVSVSLSEGTSSPNIASQIGAFVQGWSRLSVSINATGQQGASIQSITAQAAGQNYSSSSFTTGLLSASGTVTATAVDSRGNSGSGSRSYTVLAYTPPALPSVTVQRATSNGTVDAQNGTYLKVTVTGSITSLNSRNTRNFYLRYKASAASSWTTYTLSTSSYSISNQVALISGFAVTTSYNVEVVAQDFFTSFTRAFTLMSAAVTLRLRYSGPGAAFGKYPEQDNLLDTAWDMRVRGNFTTDGTIAGASTVTVPTAGDMLIGSTSVKSQLGSISTMQTSINTLTNTTIPTINNNISSMNTTVTNMQTAMNKLKSIGIHLYATGISLASGTGSYIDITQMAVQTGSGTDTTSDYATAYSVASGVVTIKAAGLFMVSFNGTVNTTGPAILGLEINGTVTPTRTGLLWMTAAGQKPFGTSVSMYLNANDRVSIVARSDSATGTLTYCVLKVASLYFA
jgi:hypothetical protein